MAIVSASRSIEQKFPHGFIATKISKKHGMSYVMPTTASSWLKVKPEEPAFYKKYRKLGGKKPEAEFNYHLSIFLELTLEAYTGGRGSRQLAYFWWQQHIKSEKEADLFFRAVDETHSYS